MGLGDVAGDALVDKLVAADVDALAFGVVRHVCHETRCGIEGIDVFVGDGGSVRHGDGFDELLRAPRKRAIDRELAGVGEVVLGEVGELLFMHRHKVAHDAIALFKDAAHERGGDVVPAEVAHALHEVFLVVLESVVVEIDVARDLTEQFVDRKRIARAIVSRPGAVHAAGDVDAG